MRTLKGAVMERTGKESCRSSGQGRLLRGAAGQKQKEQGARCGGQSCSTREPGRTQDCQGEVGLELTDAWKPGEASGLGRTHHQLG